MVQISEYNLPVKKPERNFPPVQEQCFVTADSFKQGDPGGDTGHKVSAR